MNDKFILNDKNEVEEIDDLYEWGKWMSLRKGIVKQEMVGEIKVSTVFLGLDHSFGEGEPILWETMIFHGKESGRMDRCGGTIEDARVMHDKMVQYVKASI